MFGLGTQEIVVVLIVALLVFGPQELPKIGKQVGQAMREFQKMSGDVQQALNDTDSGYNRNYTSQPYRSIAATDYSDHRDVEASETATASTSTAATIQEPTTTKDSAVAVAPTHTEDKEVKAG